MFIGKKMSGIEYANMMKNVKVIDINGVKYYDMKFIFDKFNLSIDDFKTYYLELIEAHSNKKSRPEPFFDNHGDSYMNSSVMAFISMQVCDQFCDDMITNSRKDFKERYTNIYPKDYEGDSKGLIKAMSISKEIELYGCDNAFDRRYFK